MDLTPYVDNLRRELATAAEAGGEDTRELAQRLATSLESASRLALLEALSAAADEITRELAPGSVEVRLRGRDPDFVVTPPPPDPAYEDGVPSAAGGLASASPGAAETAMGTRPPALPSSAPPEADEGGGTSRITLRLPEHLKPRIDEAAGRAGLSVNAWLVRAVSAALDAGHHAGGPGGAVGPGGGGRPGGGTSFGRRYIGWVR